MESYSENRNRNVCYQKTSEITVFHSFPKSHTCNIDFNDFSEEDKRKAISVFGMKPMDFKMFITDLNCKIELFLVPK